MKNYIIFTFLFLFTFETAMAQKDTAKKSVTISAKITTQKITVEQEQWLRKNYQQIVGMKKDSARKEIRKNFSSISDVSTEYMISQASKLVHEDNQKHLALVQQMLRSLSSQRAALSKKITAKQQELRKTKNKEKIKVLNDEIVEMKAKLKDLDKEIKYLSESK